MIYWMNLLTFLYQERKNLFERLPSPDPLDLFPRWAEESKKLGVDEMKKEVDNALDDWPLSNWQFSRFRAFHEIWYIKDGWLSLEYDNLY